MSAARVMLPFLLTGSLALAGCGDATERPGEEPAAQRDSGMATATATPDGDDAATKRKPRRGTVVVLDDSQFGSMLFDSERQAIYVFERDPERRSTCYGDCAEAWPPVLTQGRPEPGQGVRGSLLGTVERRGGERQVTYAGKPLYYYAHEGPGQVLCHNVDLNGGLWWVVGPDGEPRA